MAILFLTGMAAVLLAYYAIDPNLTVLKKHNQEVMVASVDEDKIENGIHVRTGLIEAEGLMTVVNNCTNCHSAKLVTQNRMNRDRWIATIRWMQETQNLWDLGDQEEVIINYLITNYPAPKKGRRSTLTDIEWYVLELSSFQLEAMSSFHADIAVVLQATDVDPSVPITAYDTVAMSRYPSLGLLKPFRDADRRAIDDAMHRMRIDDLADRQIHHLSGGQRQRVFVAQGLAQGADIILLDEPITGLDVTSRTVIADALADECAQGRSVITTTHSFDEAGQSDLVLLLATRCVAFGPAPEVLSEANLQNAFGGRFVRVGNTLVLDDPHHHDPHDHSHGPHHGHQH